MVVVVVGRAVRACVSNLVCNARKIEVEVCHHTPQTLSRVYKARNLLYTIKDTYFWGAYSKTTIVMCTIPPKLAKIAVTSVL